MMYLNVDMFSMGDQVPIKTVNPQKKRMIMPDVMLYTKNVMIPVVKPVPSNQSFNISFFEHKPQILKAHNYKNYNSALLLPKTASYNPLENLLEVNRMNCWKSKNQSTKYTISRKTDSPSIKKISISQNSYPSKKLSREKKNNTSHFPNTMFEQLAPFVSTSNKDLYKVSSKSIKLSRKCDLSQIKEDQIKYEDKFALVPRIKTSMSKSPVMSLSSQSFHNYTDTVSTVSALSVSSFKTENNKTFVNIERKLVPRIASQLHSSSEYEISVLHYENDVLSETNFPHSLQSHLKSINTNWSPMDNTSSAKIQVKSENINKKSAIKNHQREIDSTIRDIKYSWEIDDWIPSSQRKKCDNTYKMKDGIKIYNRKPYDCEIKYSWQVIGTSTQTSHTLLQNLLNNINKPVYKMCGVKYSWQIIGTGTQTSLHDCNDSDYWSGILLTPNKNCNENSTQIGNNETDCTKLQDFAKYSEERLKKYLVLNNQQTQTSAEKEIQSNPIDCYAKYSWHKLIKEYM